MQNFQTHDQPQITIQNDDQGTNSESETTSLLHQQQSCAETGHRRARAMFMTAAYMLAFGTGFWMVSVLQQVVLGGEGFSAAASSQRPQTNGAWGAFLALAGRIGMGLQSKCGPEDDENQSCRSYLLC